MVSTSGVPIKKLADDDVKVKLAFMPSMNRSQIMPFSKIFLWLIYGNHWNIGTEKKKVKFPTNMLFGKILMTTKSPSMREIL
jgi:hypothetical protein